MSRYQPSGGSETTPSPGAQPVNGPTSPFLSQPLRSLEQAEEDARIAEDLPWARRALPVDHASPEDVLQAELLQRARQIVRGTPS